MQEPTFLILTALATGPKHGYGVTQEVAELSEGTVRLRAGTLYGALDRLLEQELVMVDRQEVVDGRLRRYYRLTDAGAGKLAEQARRLRMTASGEVMRELPAHVRLERWYRRLLWKYPIGYRRAHGEEILTMLMDSTEPGRRRPARADVVDLVRGALRQWLRLPVGLPTMVAAVLAAAVLGAVGAASGRPVGRPPFAFTVPATAAGRSRW